MATLMLDELNQAVTLSTSHSEVSKLRSSSCIYAAEKLLSTLPAGPILKLQVIAHIYDEKY